MADFVEYPKWVKVKGDGDPRQPGCQLVNSREEEDALTPTKPTKNDPKKDDK